MDIKFNIESIFENVFYLKNISPTLNKELDNSSLGYDINFKVKVDQEKNLLAAHLIAKAIYTDIDFLRKKAWPNKDNIPDEVLQTLMELELIVTFSIEPLSNLIRKVENKKELDETLLTLVSEIVLSTARGIIHAKSQGSIVGQTPIPYINSSSFVVEAEGL